MAGDMPEIERRLEGDGFNVHHLSAQPGSEMDALQTADLAHLVQAIFVVVDGYHFGAGYQMALKNAKLHLLFIDDYGHAEFYWADLILNQNVYAQEDLYRNRNCQTVLLLGSSYVLLRLEFWSWRGWQRINSKIASKILITLGGSDPDNVTLMIIKSLNDLASRGIELLIVAGGGYAHDTELQVALDCSKVPMRLVRNASNMPDLMAWADLAIISGGTTSYETAFMGLPSMIVIIAKNQILVAEKLAEIGAAVNLGWHHDLTCERIKKIVEDLAGDRASRDFMSRMSRNLIDGRGSSRIIKAMLKRVIAVREAVADDGEQVFLWANDSDTRAASFNSGMISWDGHCNWFIERLSDENCLFLICGDEQGHSFGGVRFDIAADEAKVSINLDPGARGRGWAGFIIIRAVDELFGRRGIRKVNAFIKPENLRSARAFERAGFSNIGSCNIDGNEALHYVLTNEDLASQSQF